MDDTGLIFTSIEGSVRLGSDEDESDLWVEDFRDGSTSVGNSATLLSSSHITAGRMRLKL